MNRMATVLVLAAGAAAHAQNVEHVELSLLAAGPGPSQPMSSTVITTGGRRVSWQLSASVTNSSLDLGFIAIDLEADSDNPAPIPFEQGVAGADFAQFEPPFGFARLNADDTSAFGGDADNCGLRDIGGGQNTMGLASVDARFGQMVDPAPGIGLSGWAVVAEGSFVMPSAPGVYVVRINRAGATVLGSIPIAGFATPVRTAETECVSGEVTITANCIADVGGFETEGGVSGDGILDLIDITVFVNGFMALDPVTADMNDDGIFDLTDITIFITAFVNGCGEIEGHPLTEEEQAVLEQLTQQMAQSGSGGIAAASMPSIDVSKVDTIEPIGVVTGADIADYIQRFTARAADADLTSNTSVDIEDAEALLEAIDNADPVE